MASDLYASAVRNLLLTFSETDHYGPRIETTYFGLPTEAAGLEPTWPSRPGKKVYAYLKSSPGLKEFFSSLRQLPISLLVYHNDLPRDLFEHCVAENIRFTDERLNLQTIADEADCVLLNGTHTTTVQLLLRGVPCILAPRHPEQLLFSERVANTGATLNNWLQALVKSLRRNAIEIVLKILRHVLQDTIKER